MKFIPITAVLLAAPLASQTTFLDEDFSGGVFPPSGWVEFQSGVTAGWEGDVGLGAFHDDFQGLSESTLATLAMDLSAATACWLHLGFGQRYPNYRYINKIQATVDGGLTFLDLHQMAGNLSGGAQSMDLDLNALIGNADVRLAFFYEGDDANEWWLESVQIAEQTPPPSQYWPNLPTTHLVVTSLNEDFESLAGTIPSWIALNNLDSVTRLTDADAWCNIGQLAPCIEAFSGTYSLEMGLDSSIGGPHHVSNALIYALDGTGFLGMNLHLKVKQFMEEWNPDDGIFISQDGNLWHPVATDWAQMTAGSADWTDVSVDLGQSPVDLGGDFFLAIAEADNYPFGVHDGIIVDDIRIETTQSTLQYSLSNLVAGQYSNIDVVGALRPGSLVTVFFSPHGPGPVSTPFGDAFMTPPLTEVGSYTPTANGEVHETKWVPLAAQGAQIWTQVIESNGVTGVWSNPLAMTVQ
ncbi:MAG: hypothetical protein H8E15_05650 [Planctomycetes bacterium]|nr:hypothetical protein [Planctomycetota bacterium]